MARTIKVIRNFTAVFLVMAMLVTLIPASVFADSGQNEQDITAGNVIGENAGNKTEEAYVIEEIVEKRDAVTKHFRMSDGSMVAALYEDTVHYLDADGVWEEIDNRLSETPFSLISADKDKVQQGYANAGNSFQAGFAKSSVDQYLARVDKDGYAIGWTLYTEEDAKRDTANIQKDTSEAEGGVLTAPPESETMLAEESVPDASDTSDEISVSAAESAIEADARQIQEPVAAENAAMYKGARVLESAAVIEQYDEAEYSRGKREADAGKTPEQLAAEAKEEQFSAQKTLQSQVTYADIVAGVDIEYILRGSGVKENIVVKERQDDYTFSFKMDCAGLVLRQQEDGSILAYAEDGKEDDAPVFTLPAPYAYDANGDFTLDVRYGLRETGTGYVLSIIPGAEWCGSAALPITIDPAVTLYTNEPSFKGTIIYSNTYAQNSTYSYSSFGELAVGYFTTSGIWGVARSFVNVGLPQLQPGDKISGAYLSMAANPYIESGKSYEIDVHESKVPIDNVSWYNNSSTNSYDPTILDYHIATDSEYNSKNVHLFDVTKTVQEWYNGTKTQYGFMLKEKNEYTSGQYDMRYFYQNDPNYYYYYPILHVEYRNTNGLEDYWSYTSVAAGRGGTASVNNFNGNLVTTMPLMIGLDGTRMPVDFSLIYNSSKYNVQSNNTPTGYGWQLNYDMRIVSTNIPGFPVCFYDADGTEHYFNGEYHDEDGLGLNISMTNMYGECYIADKDGNQMFFNTTTGLLYQIKDTNGNTITVTRGIGGRIDSITDGAGRVYSFSYDTAGMLMVIYNPANEYAYFQYDNNGNLIEIRYKDYSLNTSAKTTFGYDPGSGGWWLTQVKGIDDKTDIDYDPNEKYVVRYLTWGSYTTQNTRYFFDYSPHSTMVRDEFGSINQGWATTIEFDGYGRPTGCDDQKSGLAQFYQFHKNESGDKANNGLEMVSREQQTVPNLLINGKFENPMYDGWSQIGSANTNFGYGATAHTGGNSVAISRAVSVSGELGFQQTVTGVTGKKYLNHSQYVYNYTFSAYVKTDGKLTGTGARLKISFPYPFYYYFGDIYSEPVFDTLGEWRRISVTTQFDASALNYFNGNYTFDVTCSFGFLDGNTSGATAYFDDLQLQPGEGAVSANLVENPLFINENGQSSYSHWIVDGANLSYPANQIQTEYIYRGGYILSFDANTTGAAGITSEMIPVYNGKKDDVFSFGAYAAADSAATDGRARSYGNAGLDNKPEYKVWLIFYNNNGEVNRVEAKYNPYIGSELYQFAAGGAIAAGDYSYVRLSFSYNYNINRCYFALPFVYKETFGQSYSYDTDGNVTNSTSVVNAKSEFEYKNNQLTKLNNPTGTSFQYAYNKKTNNLVSAINSDGQRYNITYDAYGNPTSLQTQDNSYAKSITDSGDYYIANVYTNTRISILSTDPSGGTAGLGTSVWPSVWTFVPAGAANQYKLKYVNVSDVYWLYAGGSGLQVSTTGG
ncbi:MAG: DNRLRE domain-containing protein, partial [Oscillospiraceae bacterium]|nr:DNRLRE domain-containing protein [Oscillospiraceae bacterium]